MYYLCLVKYSRPDVPKVEELSKLDKVVYAASVTGDIDGVVISKVFLKDMKCYPIEKIKVVGRGPNHALYLIFRNNKVTAYIIKYLRNIYLSRLEDKIYEIEKVREFDKDITYVVFRVFKDLITRRDRNASSTIQQSFHLSP